MGLWWSYDLYIVVDVKSDNGGNGRKTFVIMGYERGGQYMAYINKKREVMVTFVIMDS
jgi:hypothetical protein